jgi:hypothetical protein
MVFCLTFFANLLIIPYVGESCFFLKEDFLEVEAESTVKLMALNFSNYSESYSVELNRLERSLDPDDIS